MLQSASVTTKENDEIYLALGCNSSTIHYGILNCLNVLVCSCPHNVIFNESYMDHYSLSAWTHIFNLEFKLISV